MAKRLRGKAAVGHISAVSPLNFSKEIRAGMNLPKHVELKDMTLREGRQLEGVVLTLEQAQRTAEALDELGVSSIQMPYAKEHSEELGLMKVLKKLKTKAEIEVLVYDHQNPPGYSLKNLNETIDIILSFGFTPYLCLAIGDTLLRGFGEFRGIKNKSLQYLQEKEIELGTNIVERVKRQKGKIGSNAQDPMRADLDYFDRFCRELSDAGMGYISFDDIAMPGIPAVYKYILSRAYRAAPKGHFGCYVHDDFGFGLGAAVACVEGGAELLHCTVNGYGKRGGMLDIAQTAVALEFMYGFDTGIRLEKLYQTSRLIADIYRQPLPTTKPIVGSNAYAHGADWHVQWAFNPEHPNPAYPWVVQAIDPAIVGQKPWVALYNISGEMGIRVRAAELGLKLTTNQAMKVWPELRKEMAFRSRPIANDEFLDIVSRVIKPARIKG